MKPTVILQFHVTERCDQKCKHCYMYDETYEDRVKNELSFEDYIKIIDDYAETCKIWNVKPRMSLIGGDPLLRKDIFRILEYAKKKKIEIILVGNPYHIDEKIAKKLKQLIHSYQLSIDGMRKTHDYFRRKGSFDSSLRALRVLKDAGVKTAVMFTLSKKNASDLPRVMETVVKYNVDIFNFSRLACQGNGALLDNNFFKPEEYRFFLNKIFEKQKELKRKGAKTDFGIRDNLWRLLYSEKGIHYKRGKLGPTLGGCSIGLITLCVLSNGDVVPCRRIPIKIGKLPEQKIRDVFMNSKILNDFRNFDNFSKCKNCELVNQCRGCPAVPYGITGNYFDSDPQCWKKIET